MIEHAGLDVCFPLTAGGDSGSKRLSKGQGGQEAAADDAACQEDDPFFDPWACDEEEHSMGGVCKRVVCVC